MRRLIWLRFSLVLALLAGLGTSAVGCKDPCAELANKICDCEPDETQKQSCKDRYKTDTVKPTDAEQDRCDKLNDSCSCNALACGDFAACGLGKDAQIDLGPQTCH
jgi:hypothetical protein